MKKIKKFLTILVISLLSVSLAVSPASAEEIFEEELEVTELNLGGQDSGYKIVSPFIFDVVEEEIENSVGESYITDIIVLMMPEKDEDGSFPMFQVVASDSDAYEIDGYIYTSLYEELGDFSATFEDGTATISPVLYFDEDFRVFPEETVYVMEMYVYDKNGNIIFEVDDLHLGMVDLSALFEVLSELLFDEEFAEEEFEESEDQVTEQAAPSENLEPAEARPTSSKVVVDGKEVAFEAYNIGGSNYFKLRDLAMALSGTKKQFEVEWDQTEQAIHLHSGLDYTSDGSELKVSGAQQVQTAAPASTKMYINGERVQLTAYNINGYNYFKLRDIAEGIDFNVTWDAAYNTVGIDTSSVYIQP